MPELPDVEGFRNYFARGSLHRRIDRVRVYDKRALCSVLARRLDRRLHGRCFRDARRHGKWLLAPTDGDVVLAMHFGMTGMVQYHHTGEELPPHTRMEIRFVGGHSLDYVCQRMLGEIILVDSVGDLIATKDLGPDALDVDRRRFREIFARRRAMIKPALMNQKNVAGLGNIYVDEILFQARVHPRERLNKMTDRTIDKIFRATRRVLTTSIDRGSDARNCPRAWLIHRRARGEKCPRCGGRIRRSVVNQRGTFHCPRCQTKRK